MSIDSIREQIADLLNSVSEYDSWVEILEQATPAPYGVNDISVNVDYRDIWVDVPRKTFDFKNLEISFNLRLGGSNDRNGYDADFNKIVSGSGEFDFSEGNSQVFIKDFEINENIDLYDRE